MSTPFLTDTVRKDYARTDSGHRVEKHTFVPKSGR